MTRPSRGQCDAGHAIPPAVPVSSISFVTSHSVDGELGLVPPPLLSLLSLQGWENPTPGSVLDLPLAPSSSPPTPSGLGPVDPGAVPPPTQALTPGKGAYLCVPSVLSFMSPLSDLPPDPLPDQPVTCCLQGPALTSQGPARGLSWALPYILP